jgi:hypothetical protein
MPAEAPVSASSVPLVRREGSVAPGAAVLRKALDLCEQTGSKFCNAEFLGDLAEAVIGLGQRDAALDTVGRAIDRQTIAVRAGTQRNFIASGVTCCSAKPTKLPSPRRHSVFDLRRH